MNEVLMTERLKFCEQIAKKMGKLRKKQDFNVKICNFVVSK